MPKNLHTIINESKKLVCLRLRSSKVFKFPVEQPLVMVILVFIILRPLNIWAADNLFYNATLDLERGQLHHSIQLYKLELKANPSNEKAINNLAVILFEVGERQEAITLLERHLKNNLFSLELNYNLGLFLKRENKYLKAQKHFEKILLLRPNHLDTHYQLSQIYQEIGDDKKCERMFLKMIDLKPDDPSIILAWAKFLLKAKEYKKAHNKIKNILHQHPDNFELNYYYALTLEGQRIAIEKRIAQWEKVLKIDQCHVDSRYFLARNFEKSDKSEVAKQHYLTIIKKNPSYYRAYIRLGILENLKQNHLLAIDYLDKTIDFRPKQIRPYEIKAKIFIDQKKFDLAAKQFDIITAYYPQYPTPYAFRSLLFHHLGYNKKSIEQFNKAKRLFLRAIKKDRKSIDLRMEYAMMFYSLGDYNNAEREFEKILVLDKDNSDANYHAGQINFFRKNLHRAHSYFIKVDQDHQYYKEALQLIKNISLTLEDQAKNKAPSKSDN